MCATFIKPESICLDIFLLLFPIFSMNKNETHENGLVIVLLWVCVCVCARVFFHKYVQSTLIHCIWLMNKCIGRAKNVTRSVFSSSVNDFECVIWSDRDYFCTLCPLLIFVFVWRNVYGCWIVYSNESIGENNNNKNIWIIWKLLPYYTSNVKHHQPKHFQKGINHFDRDSLLTLRVVVAQ